MNPEQKEGDLIQISYLLRVGFIGLGVMLAGVGLTMIAVERRPGPGLLLVGTILVLFITPSGGKLSILGSIALVGALLTAFLPTAGSIELALAGQTDYQTWQTVGARHVILLMGDLVAAGIFLWGARRSERRASLLTSESGDER